MPQPNIKLIEKLEARNDGNTSKQFISIFGSVVDSYLLYREWCKKIIKKNGEYHGIKDETEIINRFIKAINLVEDILVNGQKEPIRIYEEKEGIEIDGYHRLIIANKLNRLCKL